MPMLKSGGATLVAIAALCLATSVQAAPVNLIVDSSQSSLTMGGFIDASSIGGVNFKNLPFVPQAPGSNTTSYVGSINIDVTPGTLQLLPGSNVIAQNSGVWQPINAPANYGLAIPGIALVASFSNLTFDWGILADASILFPATPVASTPMPLSGVGVGNFDLFGQGAGLTGVSFFALTSGLGSGAGQVDESPIISFGQTAADIGTWDGTTLTLPVHSTVTTVIQASPLVTQTITMTGLIVATVPEPSSIFMAGLGVVGLVTVGYRSRKRKA